MRDRKHLRKRQTTEQACAAHKSEQVGTEKDGMLVNLLSTVPSAREKKTRNIYKFVTLCISLFTTLFAGTICREHTVAREGRSYLT